MNRFRPRLRKAVSRASVGVNAGGRTLLGISLVDAVGTGLYLAGSAVFFTRVVGLSAAEVGVGLSLGGLLGLLAQPVIGWLADRWGPRHVLALLNLWRAAGFTAYVFTDSFAMFLVVAALLGIGELSFSPVRQALAERVVGAEHRVGMMARIRVVDNVGFSIGALLATVAIAAETRLAFDAIMLGNAVTFVIASALLPRVALLPVADAVAVAARRSPLRLRALRDTRYVAVAAVNGILALHIVLLLVGVPLWITLHTTAPPALVGLLLVLNTVMAITLQVRVARASEKLVGSVTVLRRGGVALALACGLFALAAHGQETALVVAILVLGMAALTAGELLQSAGGWGLSFLLAPTWSRAEYLATFSLGTSMQFVLGPTLVTVAVLGNGSLGWVALAAVFLLAAAAVGPLVSRATRRPALTGASPIPAGGHPPVLTADAG